MADLKSLFAKKAPDSNGQSGTAPVQATNDAAESSSVRNGEAGSGEVQSEPTTPPATPSQPANTVPKKFAFGVGSKGVGPTAKPVSGGESTGDSEQPKPGLSTLRLPTGARDSGSDTGGVASSPLDSLDALDSSEDAGVEPRGDRVTYFADETPATKPTRELPDGLTKEQLGFVDMIDSIYEIIHDPDLLGGVIRNIMVELKSNPEYTKLMAPDDFRTMVRGMRESMGLARVKKQESKAKRSGGGARKSKQLDDDVLAGLDDILGDIS